MRAVPMNRVWNHRGPNQNADSDGPDGDPSPPHLLHVHSTFGPGGAQVLIANVINHLGSRYRHTIIAADGDYGCKARIADHSHVTYLPLEDGDDGILRRIARYRKTL